MRLCRFLAAAIAWMVMAPAHAGNVAGLWFNRNESGWGLNLSQQGRTAFATMFVYGTNNRPAWFVAPDLATADAATYSGDLYETNGPWWGGAFNPNAVAARPVGRMTFTTDIGLNATLTYSIDGMTVVKSLERQTWRAISLAGDFRTAFVRVTTPGAACPGLALSTFDDIRFRDNGTVTIYTASGTPACEISGQYLQYGHYNSLSGAITCGPVQSNFSGSILFHDVRAEGITGLTTSTEFLTGVVQVRGPGNCFNAYSFSGTKYTP